MENQYWEQQELKNAGIDKYKVEDEFQELVKNWEPTNDSNLQYQLSEIKKFETKHKIRIQGYTIGTPANIQFKLWR